MQNTGMTSWTKYLRWVPFLGIAVLLFFTFRLYRSAYFWLDDFDNLYWAQKLSAFELLKAITNPASTYFRPTGMLFYWLELRVFGTNEVAYHVLAWFLHALNTALVYLVLRRIVRSHPGAAVGAMLFACQAVFTDIYWNFGTIFELVSGLLFLVGILIWSADRRSWARVVLATVVFLLAVKGKEMAITLPAIWLCYDLLIRTSAKWRHIVQIVLPGIAGVLTALKGLAENRATSPDAPYFMDISAITLGRGFGVYFGMLSRINLKWQLWAIGFVALFLLFAWMKRRTAEFFHIWIFITFLPVIFLVNHRYPFYWYIPFVGACGLAACFVEWVIPQLNIRISAPAAEAAACLCFLALCQATYLVQKRLTRYGRNFQHGIEVDHRAFMQGLMALPPPPPNEVLYFESAPRYFEEVHLLSATQVALRRTDVEARFVDRFPPNARYRLSFKDSKLIRISEGE
jgi:hypothetical protein